MKAGKKKCPSSGVAHIWASFNNTKVTVTSLSGDVIGWKSGGSMHKGARKSTSSVAEDLSKELAERLHQMGLIEVKIRVKGMGSGRDGAVRGLHAGGLKVLSIRECTPIAHNGCRKKKRRRV
jgi:small subunit ribosomal protein S11